MDPLSAIGLISSVITFIDFGYEIVAASEEVRTSTTGTTKANDQIEFLNVRLKSVAVELATAKRDEKYMSVDQKCLVEVADKCLELSDDLQRLLDKLKAKNPSSKRQVLSALARNVRNKNQKKDLEVRLDQCRQLLQLQLSHTTRLESISRLIEISRTGKCQEKELALLSQQLAVLTDTVAGMKSHSKLQDQARHIFDLSDHAVSKVLQNKVLEALQFEQMESRFDSIESAHTETFEWLLEDVTSESLAIPAADSSDPWLRKISYHLEEEEPIRHEIRRDFNNWLCTGTGIFHISGKPGAGKSTLMKYLVESDRMKVCLSKWADDRELVLASFFFWRHGTSFQRSLQGLLRSLLHSVLKQHPDLIRVVFPEQWEIARNSPGSAISFRQTDIQRAYSELTATSKVHLKHKFAFFIDGLDEFQGHDDTLIKILFDWAQSSLGNIKICVSSRELPIFQTRFLQCPKFRLHEATRHDIFIFVYNTLRDNEDMKSLNLPEEMTHLVSTLVERAEGVFLWVSLALRLVERGLLEEESIEDLKSSIKVLPIELEELFQVIFDSIKREPDTAKRRKAMRFLSLAVDEVEARAIRGQLFLAHLSYMDDYDRKQDFADNLQGQLTTTEVQKRLSRCQKQLGGWCRGFLSIRSETWRKAEDPFRRETVQLAHRSLVEFFKLANVRKYIEEHSQGFDRLHFYCQSLIAELKTWSPITVQSIRRRGYFGGPTAYDPSAGEGDGRSWFENDTKRLIGFYHYIKYPKLTTMFSALTQLGRISQVEENSTSKFHTNYICQWRGPGAKEGPLRTYCSSSGVQCLARPKIMLWALEWGVVEFWTAKVLDGSLFPTNLHLVSQALLDNDHSRAQTAYQDCFLRILATSFTQGTSANSLIVNQEPHVSVSVWQNLVWTSIVNMRPKAYIVPVWLLFLLYGADESFELSFEQSSESEKSGKLVSVTGHWGLNKQQVHSPIHIPENHEGILALAKSQNWSVSLMDIVDFWFPLYAEKFHKIHKIKEQSVGLPREHLQDLKKDFGVDVESWQTQLWDIPEPLFRTWSGISQLLIKDSVTGQVRKPKQGYWSHYVAHIASTS